MGRVNTLFNLVVVIWAPGRFAQKPVPPGTVRDFYFFERDVSSRDGSLIFFFRTGRFLPGRFAHFSKFDFKVLFIKLHK